MRGRAGLSPGRSQRRPRSPAPPPVWQRRRSAQKSKARRGTSKQISQRDIDGRLAILRRQTTERACNVEHECSALQAKAEGCACITAAVVTDEASAQVNFVLIHHIRAESNRFAAECARVDVTTCRAELSVLDVVVDEFEPVEGANLDLRRKRNQLVGFGRVKATSEVAYGRAKCRSEERRVGKECRSRWSPY